MKNKNIVFTALLLLGTVTLISCRSTYPGYRTARSIPLIISPHPGFTMSMHPNGRYYHQTRSGIIYWRGYDNRFYMDKAYIARHRYNRVQYNEWQRQGRRNSGRRF